MTATSDATSRFSEHVPRDWARAVSPAFFLLALAKSCPRSRSRISISSSFLRAAAENPIYPPSRPSAQATRRRRFRLSSFSLLVSRARPRSFLAAASYASPRLSSTEHALPSWLPRLRPRVRPSAIRTFPARISSFSGSAMRLFASLK